MLRKDAKAIANRSNEIRKLPTKEDKIVELTKLVEQFHTEKSRWSVSAIVDVIIEYWSAENYYDYVWQTYPDDNESLMFAGGQKSALQELLMGNGWSAAAGIL